MLKTHDWNDRKYHSTDTNTPERVISPARSETIIIDETFIICHSE